MLNYQGRKVKCDLSFSDKEISIIKVTQNSAETATVDDTGRHAEAGQKGRGSGTVDGRGDEAAQRAEKYRRQAAAMRGGGGEVVAQRLEGMRRREQFRFFVQ